MPRERKALDRNRACAEVHRWQIDHIRNGMREAKAGKFVSDAEVQRVIDRLRPK